MRVKAPGEETVHVMITMPAEYKKRLTDRARAEGRTVSGMVRRWLLLAERAEIKKLYKKAGL